MTDARSDSVSRSVAAGEDLRQELSQVREILHSLPGLVFQGRVEAQALPRYVLTSQWSRWLLGLSPEALVAHPDGLFCGVYAKDRPRLALALGWSARWCKPVRVNFRLTAQDGTRRWALLHAVPVREPQGARWNGFLYDISEEDRLREALGKARAAAEQASRAKSEFMASMSHELRTPMNAILSFAWLGQRGSDPERQRDYFAKIETAARGLLGIINDVLDLSKVEAGRMELGREPFPLEQVLDHFESVVGLRAQEKALAFAVRVDPAVPRTLVGDPLRLGQVLLNLGGNAVKFTEQGRVEVDVRALEAPAPGAVKLEFSVSDTGIGLSAEQAARLFQPFVQADSSTTRRFGGTGLGLSISKRLVQLMGGEIDLRSALGEGSTFRFTACFGCAQEGAPLPHLARAATPGEATLQGLRVLVVDDHDANLEVARELLQSAGVVVTLATSGPAAIQLLAGDGASRFDAVFMDMRMPDMDGVEATRRIRAAEGPGRRLPIIALTANVMAPDRERCLAAGMDDFVGKPIEVERLFAALAQATGRALPGVAADAGHRLAAASALDHDYEGAMRRVERAPELYARLAQRYMDYDGDPVQALRGLLQAGRIADAARSAHTLKGFAGQVGALRVARLAAALEARLDAGEQPEAEALQQLERALEDSRLRLRAMLAVATPEPGTGRRDPAQALRLRDRLEHDLEDGEDSAWEIYEALCASLEPETRKALQGVGAHIASEEYDAALRLLRAL